MPEELIMPEKFVLRSRSGYRIFASSDTTRDDHYVEAKNSEPVGARYQWTKENYRRGQNSFVLINQAHGAAFTSDNEKQGNDFLLQTKPGVSDAREATYRYEVMFEPSREQANFYNIRFVTHGHLFVSTYTKGGTRVAETKPDASQQDLDSDRYLWTLDSI